MAFWGYHAMFDCASCDKEAIQDREVIEEFIAVLVHDINMIAYGDPLIEHFATHAPDKAGYSFVQLIETSNVTGHFSDLTGDAYIDIFSCKEIDIEVAQKLIEFYFSPKKVRVNFITRSA